jgi:uncharacterized protein (TIGR02265 family)
MADKTTPKVPTIKGVFVNSHVEAVRHAKGDEGVHRLEEAFGASVAFGATQDVPIRDEVKIIELALDILADTPVDPNTRAFEAGRLHFRNFTTTPWAKILFTIFPRNYKYMVKHSPTIAERVFNGVRFQSEDLGPTAHRVIMENNDYPIDHFRGLFYEWMHYFGLKGDVQANESHPGRYEYTMYWENAR